MVTVAAPRVPTMCPLVNEITETLKFSSVSITPSSIIIISNEALVDPIGNIALYGPEL